MDTPIQNSRFYLLAFAPRVQSRWGLKLAISVFWVRTRSYEVQKVPASIPKKHAFYSATHIIPNCFASHFYQQCRCFGLWRQNGLLIQLYPSNCAVFGKGQQANIPVLLVLVKQGEKSGFRMAASTKENKAGFLPVGDSGVLCLPCVRVRNHIRAQTPAHLAAVPLRLSWLGFLGDAIGHQQGLGLIWYPLVLASAGGEVRDETTNQLNEDEREVSVEGEVGEGVNAGLQYKNGNSHQSKTIGRRRT